MKNKKREYKFKYKTPEYVIDVKATIKKDKIKLILSADVWDEKMRYDGKVSDVLTEWSHPKKGVYNQFVIEEIAIFILHSVTGIPKECVQGTKRDNTGKVPVIELQF